MSFSDYIAYFDESGDHGLESIDPEFPVFVLCGCLFKIEHYLQRELAAFSAIKFAHFGHDAVVFHSRDIRKKIGPFQILANADKRQKFMDHIALYFKNCAGVLVAAGIDKKRHVERYRYPIDPYSIALLFCLERLYAHLHDMGVSGEAMMCVFEQRGKAEDNELAAQFARICGGENQWGQLPFKMVFASKLANMPSLQVSDLAAYPIARHIIASDAPNPSYDALEARIRKSPSGKILGWGLKVFP
jgi:hypothetical protein